MRLMVWIIVLPFFIFLIIITYIVRLMERFYIGFFDTMNKLTEIVNKNKTRSEEKRAAREEKRGSKRGYRIEKIKALTAKAYAVATKRKWLVFMMALGIAIYFIITSGGGFSFMGTFETVKGFFN